MTTDILPAVKAALQNALSATIVDLVDFSDNPDALKIELYIVSDAFEGKNTLARQRLVYAALGSFMDPGPIHALTFKKCATLAEHSRLQKDLK